MRTLPGARILVIDDDPNQVRILRTCLRQDGHQVLGAFTGDSGLGLFMKSGPDLVVLDIGLPGGPSGLEVLKSIHTVNPNTKVIMVTGNTDPERARKALELGAIAYVDKPFDCDYLKRVVAMALREGAKTTDS